MKWINKSNRWLHLFAGLFIAIVFTFFGSLIAGVTAEYKDKAKGGKFDFLDLAATLIGGLVGQAIQILIVFIAYKDGINSVLLGIAVNIVFFYLIPAILLKDYKWIYNFLRRTL